MELSENVPDILSPLYTDVVLDNIFKFLSTKDLKLCRLVCQNWRYASKGVFKKRVAVAFHNTESPIHIRFFGKGLKPSTTNFLNLFQGKEFPSDTYYFYDEAWKWGDPMNRDFLLQYGKSIRTFKACVKENAYTISVEEILTFRNNLLLFIPNVEELSLTITLSELHPSETKFSIRDFKIGSEEDQLASIQLVYLKKLKIHIGCEGSDALTQLQKEIATKVFLDIIKRTKRLEFLDINVCPAMLEMIKQLPVQYFKFLDYVRLSDWKCTDMDAAHIIDFLSELSQKETLKLKSLSIQFDFDECEDHHVRNVIRVLMDFLNFQKNNLLKLSIRLPNLIGNGSRLANVLREDRILIHFPKLLKLTTLKLNRSLAALLELFYHGVVWTDLFPKLKALEYRFSRIYGEVQEFTLFQTMDKIKCNSLTKINIIVQQNSHIGIMMMTSDNFRHVYVASKEIFPNLERFRVRYIIGDENYLFSSEDFFLIANCQRLPYHQGDDDDCDEEGEEDPNRRFQESDFFESEFDYCDDDTDEEDDDDMMPMMNIEDIEDDYDENEFEFNDGDYEDES